MLQEEIKVAAGGKGGNNWRTASAVFLGQSSARSGEKQFKQKSHCKAPLSAYGDGDTGSSPLAECRRQKFNLENLVGVLKEAITVNANRSRGEIKEGVRATIVTALTLAVRWFGL